MDILQVVPFFGTVHGGAAVVVSQVAHHLERKGHHVTIATTDYRFDRGDIEKLGDRTDVIPFKTRARLGLFIYTPEMNSWLSTKADQFDVVHIHTFRSYQSAAAYRFTQKFGVPYIMEAHGSLPLHNKKAMKTLYDILFGNRMARDIDRGIALSTLELKTYLDMGFPQDLMEIVPLGITMSKYDRLPDRGAFRSRYNIGDDELMILFMGRIDPIKGTDLLVQAFAELGPTAKKCRLVMVGPDFGYLSTLKSKIRELGIEDRVLFTGLVKGEEITQAYVAADVCVMPSRFESFGLIPLEAMACGTPVIVTNRCGSSQVVSDAAMVIDYDVGQLREALRSLIEDDERRISLGKAGRKKVQEFDWSRIIDRTVGIYQDVLESRS